MTRRRIERHAPRARRGFTLVELLVAITLTGLVAGTIMTVLVRQQRFYRTTADLIHTRSQIRQAVSILPQDLRGISSVAGDIREMRDSSFDFFTSVGTGVVCQADAPVGTRQQLYLVPRNGALGPLTTWMSEPRFGDRVSVYDTTGAQFSDRLKFVKDLGATTALVGVAAGSACAGSPFITAADAAKQPLRFKVELATTANVAPSVVVGMPVRFLRRVRYSLYRSASDTQWYLGYREYDEAGTLSPVQPVSGPYRPYAADTTSGLTFTYRNAAGSVLALTDTTQVARVDVEVRGLTRSSGEIAGLKRRADGRYAASDRFTAALRNRW